MVAKPLWLPSHTIEHLLHLFLFVVWTVWHNTKCVTSLQNISASPSVCSHTHVRKLLWHICLCALAEVDWCFGSALWSQALTSPPQRPSWRLSGLSWHLSRCRFNRHVRTEQWLAFCFHGPPLRPDNHRHSHGVDDVDSGSERWRISEVELSLTHLDVCMFVFTCSALVLLFCVVSCSQTSQAEIRASLPQPAPPVQEMPAFTLFFFAINFPTVDREQLSGVSIFLKRFRSSSFSSSYYYCYCYHVTGHRRQ